MPRPPRGIYRKGDAVVGSGYRRPADRPGETWETVTDPAARDLLRGTEFADLVWDGTTVVRRNQPEIDARLRTEAIAQDDARFESEREKAILMVLLDEINVLRDAAGLSLRTIQQAKSAYVKKLDR